jgi:signal transduction histidine kinase/DNA-binding response OmpR family regulator
MQKKLTFKTITFILEILVFGLFCIISQNLHSQETGYKYFKNYSYKEYNHSSQNWGMAQAENGIIYVANQGGVLEFDGASWRIIYEDIPNYTVRSIAIDDKGTIYIGGNNEIGYLAPNGKGVLKYNSLRGYLPENQGDFSDVYKTYASEKGVYFQTPKFLFRWDSKQMKVWEPKERFFFSFICKKELFIREKKVGLMRMVNDSLEKVPGGEIFTTISIYMMVPYDSKSVLIGTDAKGLYIYNGTTIVPFPTEMDDYLKKNKLYHGIRLTTGDFALATLMGGLIIMDSHGHRKNIFDKTYGLQDNQVFHVFEDNGGNLWLCLNNGISKIEYVSPISIHDDRSNLPGLVLSVVRHHNKLYVGTTNGLYYYRSPLKFGVVPGISAYCWSLLSTEASLLAATNDGVFQVEPKNNTKRVVINDSTYVLLPSKHHPDRTWCGTKLELVALYKENDRWIEELRFKTINQQIRSIAEDKKGNVWLGTLTGSVLKVDFPGDISKHSVNRYDSSHGLPDGEIYAARAAGHVLFGTGKGLFRFDENEKRFIPDETLEAKFAGGPDSKPVFRIIEDKNKSIWLISESRIHQAIPQSSVQDRTYIIKKKPFLRLPTAQVNTIYPDPDGKTIWFGSLDGLIHYDSTLKKNYKQNFQILIRKVLTNEKLIFGGFKSKTNKASKVHFPIIEYKDRNLLQFEFAAPFFEGETETYYQYLLEGYEDNWSSWNKNGKKNYTNLDSGLYTFKVKAKNVYENISNEDAFQFKILLPWYRTWWALLSYVLVLFMMTYLIVKWRRSIRLEHEKLRLEKVVKERTREIMEKSLQLEEQSEKLKEMDTVKSRFFANISHEFRTPLTLIMSPLEEMLSDSQDKKQKNKINMMLRYSQQLLRYINQLLDLSRFDSDKMKLQAACQNIVPFLKGTMASFHMLAQKNKLDLKFQSQEENISLYFDAQKMEEVMDNLLINAIKFTPSKGKITVSVSVGQQDPETQGPGTKEVGSRSLSTQGFVEISVRDTGIGMAKEQLDHIFDRFFQAKNFKEKGHNGTGIGLALTREIINLHHGKIDVHSQEGKGTEFVIRLPMGDDHLKQDEIAAAPETTTHRQQPIQIEALDMIKEEEADMETGDGDEGVEIETYAENGDRTEAQEKNVILVVEDHRDMRKHIRSPLDPIYTVVEAGDGKEGITKAKEIIPDLIVSDIMMPKKDGYELCRELKNDIKTSHIPIILLTAKASEDSMIQGLETGADDYITKPFNSKMLLTRIKNLIDLRRQLQLKIQRQKTLLPVEIEVSSMDEEFLKEFQDIIEKNLSDPEFNIDTFCKKLYMGRSTLFRKVQALTGETPNQFILTYRLDRAAQLLKGKVGNVTEVAMKVGFSTSAYFAKCFREKFHQSPSSFQASESE